MVFVYSLWLKRNSTANIVIGGAAGAVPVLVGHLLVPGLTEDVPTSLSPAAIDGLLRAELGFGGVVITDALGMNAVSDRWDNAQAAALLQRIGPG